MLFSGIACAVISAPWALVFVLGSLPPTALMLQYALATVCGTGFCIGAVIAWIAHKLRVPGWVAILGDTYAYVSGQFATLIGVAVTLSVAAGETFDFGQLTRRENLLLVTIGPLVIGSVLGCLPVLGWRLIIRRRT